MNPAEMTMLTQWNSIEPNDDDIPESVVISHFMALNTIASCIEAGNTCGMLEREDGEGILVWSGREITGPSDYLVMVDLLIRARVLGTSAQRKNTGVD